MGPRIPGSSRELRTSKNNGWLHHWHRLWDGQDLHCIDDFIMAAYNNCPPAVKMWYLLYTEAEVLFLYMRVHNNRFFFSPRYRTLFYLDLLLFVCIYVLYIQTQVVSSQEKINGVCNIKKKSTRIYITRTYYNIISCYIIIFTHTRSKKYIIKNKKKTTTMNVSHKKRTV